LKLEPAEEKLRKENIRVHNSWPQKKNEGIWEELKLEPAEEKLRKENIRVHTSWPQEK